VQTGYHSHGVPLETYQLTKADHRAQKEMEDTCQWAREQAAKAPRWSDEKWRSINAILGRSAPTPAHLLMRWRVRLYCGHIVQLTRQIENKNPFGLCFTDHRCPHHQNRQQVIVAYEPLGPLGPPPADAAGASPTPRRETSSQKLKRLEAENAELRAEIERRTSTSEQPED
jgi:hypothetical protein